MRVGLAIYYLVVAGCAALASGVEQHAVRQQEPVAVEFRLAEDAPAPGLTEAEVVGQAERVYLHPHAELSNEQLAHVEPVVGDGGLLVKLWFTDEGSERVAGLTAANLGRRLAVLINTHVVAAAAIVQPLRPGTPRPVTLSVQLPRREAERLAESVSRTWPTQQPH